MDWWKEARFGMFIHWGVYSGPGRGEWIMYQEHIPYDEYRILAGSFQPRAYDPAKWVAVAKEAGMKYVVLPQGYPKSNDVLQPLVKQAHDQVRELLTNYGKVDILWFDGMAPGDTGVWRSDALIRMARQLQPDIVINDRVGTAGDFVTPENVVTAHNQPWESCYTMNRTWGYAPTDNNYKPVAELIRLLASCVSQGGNFLLNVSPDGDGKIPDRQITSLGEIGNWVKKHDSAIYKAEPSPIVAPNLGFQCRVGDKVYLFIQRWPGAVLPFAWCGSSVKSAKILTTGQTVQVEQKEDRVWLKGLPITPPDPYMNVVELTFEGEPKATNPAYR